jgi:bifunctional non-homologous end joining protein LigD
MAEKTVRIGRYSVELSRPRKKMYPEDGITKEDVVDYYQRIAPVALPHMKGRPLVMHRFPNGIKGEDFYQKAVPDYFPDWIKRKKVRLVEGGWQELAVVEKAADLVYLANQACLVPHVWLSRADNVNNPDRMIFDLDPSSDDFGEVKFAALELKKMLEEPDHHFDRVRKFAEIIAGRLADQFPEKVTTEPRKQKRRGRLLLDVMRNSYGQTSVVPYALRAIPGAPVAAPLDWEELSGSGLNAQSYNLANIFRRLGRKQDPWRSLYRHSQKLET